MTTGAGETAGVALRSLGPGEMGHWIRHEWAEKLELPIGPTLPYIAIWVLNGGPHPFA